MYEFRVIHRKILNTILSLKKHIKIFYLPSILILFVLLYLACVEISFDPLFISEASKKTLAYTQEARKTVCGFRKFHCRRKMDKWDFPVFEDEYNIEDSL